MTSTRRDADNEMIPPADHELLSAYLDGQLSSAELLTVEQRLAAEPALRAELDELRTVVTLLRELPARTPPRSFTLDLNALPRRRWQLFAPLRLATIAAALLLMLSATPDLLGLAAPKAAPTSDTAVEQAGQAPAPAAATMAPAAAPTTSAAMQSAPAQATMAAPAAPAAGAAQMQESAPAATTAAPAAEAAPDAAAMQESARSATAAADEPALPLPSGSVLTAAGSSSPGTDALPPLPPTPSQPLPWWRWLQIVFAAAATALGAATLWARWQER